MIRSELISVRTAESHRLRFLPDERSSRLWKRRRIPCPRSIAVSQPCLSQTVERSGGEGGGDPNIPTPKVCYCWRHHGLERSEEPVNYWQISVVSYRHVRMAVTTLLGRKNPACGICRGSRPGEAHLVSIAWFICRRNAPAHPRPVKQSFEGRGYRACLHVNCEPDSICGSRRKRRLIAFYTLALRGARESVISELSSCLHSFHYFDAEKLKYHID